jgi:hypothetical protein
VPCRARGPRARHLRRRPVPSRLPVSLSVVHDEVVGTPTTAVAVGDTRRRCNFVSVGQGVQD